MFKLLKRFTPLDWTLSFISVIFVAVQVFLELRIPDYMQEITMLVTMAGSKMADIWAAGGKMLLCAVLSLVCSILVGFLAARIAAGFSRTLRGSIFKKVLSFSTGEVNKFSTPSLITRSTNDVTQVQMLIALGLQMIIKSPIMAVWAISKISGKGFEWTLATGLGVLLLVIVVSTIFFFAVPKFKKIQTLTDNVNRIARENLTGLRVVRAYNAEEYQEEKFENANYALMSNHLYTGRLTALIMPTMSFIQNGLTLSIYWIGAFLIANANIMDKFELFSNMVVFSSYAIQVVMSFMMLTMIFIMAPRVAVSAHRINEVLDTKISIHDGDGKIKASSVGEVEFKNVSFKYPEAEDYILHNISFTAKKGETVAFIGATGSGKSSIINLIPRFYDASLGEVLVDGVDVRDYALKDLRNKLGYIPQKSVLFSGSVMSNVTFGDNGRNTYEMENVKKAIKIAQSTDFVEAMEGGYEGDIAQGGSNVSGGQKQRLSIARAICRDPEIFIFDDSFSALDYKTDKALRKTIKEELSEATLLIVAQRIGTIRDADKIIVLEDGEAVGMGTHKELMKTCEVYKEIALSQLSEEELRDE